jgi:ABC-type nitrate/sulfonate/bicarbonate transport system substrate-binding protein
MGGRTPALYDLRSDIGETTDVADDNPEVVQELQCAIKAFQKDLDEHSLEAPLDAGQTAYKEGKEGKASKKNRRKKGK